MANNSVLQTHFILPTRNDCHVHGGLLAAASPVESPKPCLRAACPASFLPRQCVCAERTDRVLQDAPPPPRERRLPANDEHRAGRRGGHVGARLAASGRLRSRRPVARSPERGGAGRGPRRLAALEVEQAVSSPDWLRSARGGPGGGRDAWALKGRGRGRASPTWRPSLPYMAAARKANTPYAGALAELAPPKLTGGDAGGKCGDQIREV